MVFKPEGCLPARGARLTEGLLPAGASACPRPGPTRTPPAQAAQPATRTPCQSPASPPREPERGPISAGCDAEVGPPRPRALSVLLAEATGGVSSLPSLPPGPGGLPPPPSPAAGGSLLVWRANWIWAQVAVLISGRDPDVKGRARRKQNCGFLAVVPSKKMPLTWRAAARFESICMKERTNVLGFARAPAHGISETILLSNSPSLGR